MINLLGSQLMNISIPNKWLLFFIVSIVLIGLPRFDRQDLFGVDRYTTEGKPASIAKGDARHYENHILYFRGEVYEEKLKEPWVYRPLPTYIASFLPFKAMTSLNILNYMALVAGLIFLLKIFSMLNLSFISSMAGAFFYTFSFPVFYYGTIGYMDPFLVGSLTIALYLILAQRNVLFFILFILGALIKETFIIILPVWVIYQALIQKRSLIIVCAAAGVLGLCFLGVMILVRMLTPVDSGFLWVPKSEMVLFNLFRFRSWFSFLLTLGPAGIIAFYYLIRINKNLIKTPISIVFTTGFLAGFSVFVYSMLSAYADGRYFWIAYPFMLPLACIYIEKYILKRGFDIGTE